MCRTPGVSSAATPAAAQSRCITVLGMDHLLALSGPWRTSPKQRIHTPVRMRLLLGFGRSGTAASVKCAASVGEPREQRPAPAVADVRGGHPARDQALAAGFEFVERHRPAAILVAERQMKDQLAEGFDVEPSRASRAVPGPMPGRSVTGALTRIFHQVACRHDATGCFVMCFRAFWRRMRVNKLRWPRPRGSPGPVRSSWPLVKYPG